jgi:drug/metabolite transporter (DMT)-like permease
MTLLFLGLLLFQMLFPTTSIMGKSLVLYPHPFMVGLRWFTIGLLAALLAVRYRWSGEDWLTWTAAGLVVVSLVRKHEKKESDVPK